MTQGRPKRQTQQSPSSLADLWISTTPLIRDPRELRTILTTSLRSLWGTLEPYSAVMRVGNDTQAENNDKNPLAMLVVTCPAAHAPQIQAALSLVTPPPYLQDTLYRLDVVKMEYRNGDCENDEDGTS